MSLMDLFRPKWKHSNLKVRKAAVEQIQDQSILAKIAKEDPDAIVRRTAVERVDAQILLADVVRTDSAEWVRRAAVERIEEQSLLAEIAKTDSNANVRQIAVERIKDESLLKDIAIVSKHWKVREVAVDHINKQSLLVELAKGPAHMSVCKSAVERIGKQFLLVDIVKTAFFPEICRKAMNRVTEQSLLTDIVKTVSDSETRRIAIQRIDDQALLIELVKTDADQSVRKAAVPRINDPIVLSEIAKNDAHTDVRKVAIQNIKEQEILAEIAKADPEPKIRLAAIKQLTNQNVLAEIVFTESDEEIRKTVVRHLNDQDLLLDVAISDSSIGVQLEAVKRITDQTALAEIAKTNANWSVREIAAEQITSTEVLRDIAKNDTNNNVRLTAQKRLKKQTFKQPWSAQLLTFSDAEKRLLLEFPVSVIKVAHATKKSGSEAEFVIPNAPEQAIRLMRQVSITDLQQLMEVRGLSDQADRTYYPKDIALYKKVLELAPWDAISAMSIGSSYWNAGNKQEALRWMKKAHELAPESSRIKTNLDGMLAQETQAGKDSGKEEKKRHPMMLPSLIGATDQGDIATVKSLLLNQRVDVNTQGQRGYTALITAAVLGYTDIVKLLLDHGADIDVVADDGHTALTRAEKHEHEEIVRLLKEAESKDTGTLNKTSHKVKVDYLLVKFNTPGPGEAELPSELEKLYTHLRETCNLELSDFKVKSIIGEIEDVEDYNQITIEFMTWRSIVAPELSFDEYTITRQGIWSEGPGFDKIQVVWAAKKLNNDKKQEDLAAKSIETEKIGFSHKLHIGMPLDDIIQLLGEPTSHASGTSLLGMVFSTSGSSQAAGAGEYYFWDRPEGKYRLIIHGEKLAKIHGVP